MDKCEIRQHTALGRPLWWQVCQWSCSDPSFTGRQSMQLCDICVAGKTKMSQLMYVSRERRGLPLTRKSAAFHSGAHIYRPNTLSHYSSRRSRRWCLGSCYVSLVSPPLFVHRRSGEWTQTQWVFWELKAVKCLGQKHLDRGGGFYEDI